MSLFKTVTLGCPACGAPVEFGAVHSVNADARPDLREAILAGTFQQQECSKCGETFRLDPEFNLLDVARGHWIAAAPLASLPHWHATEEHARSVFERAFGAAASGPARTIGAGLRPRVTFGWPALREKLVAIDNDLDDVILELCKAAIMRSTNSPIAGNTELRLLAVTPENLSFSWLLPAQGVLGPGFLVARALYDEIAADADGAWEELRGELSAGMFIDLNRLLIVEASAGSPQ